MKEPYIIAETACAHDGSLIRLMELVDAAHEAGCDAVQFQVWDHRNIVTPDHPSIELLKRIQLTEHEWRNCFEYTKRRYPELEIVACVSDRFALQLCEKLGADAFKIHTADLGNYDLLERATQIGRRIDLSIGASTFSEIQSALDTIRDRTTVWLMYGYQLFPTPTDGLNLNIMRTLERAFGLDVGYQDHSPPDKSSAFTIPIAAIGAGIRIIEKHITDVRARAGTDSEAALEPAEMKIFVTNCQEAARALGNGHHRAFSDEEIKYRKYSKKSLVASRDLQAGEKLKHSDIVIMRGPELGIPSDCFDEVINAKIKFSLKKHTILKREHFEVEV